MCYHSDSFSSFEELDGGFVHMNNDSSCKTIKIGSIRLKNHDGSTRVLTDARYIPSLRKNLISLGTLKVKGFAMSMRDGILKVISSVLVVMKGTRNNNLYYFQGSTVIRITTTIFKDNVDLERTRL